MFFYVLLKFYLWILKELKVVVVVIVVEVVEFPHSQQQQGCVLKNEKR